MSDARADVRVAGTVRIEASDASETAPLRQRVLRPHKRIEELAVPGDDDPRVAYLAARTDDSTVVGTVRIAPVECPWPDSVGFVPNAAWQLRAMATDPQRRGRGIGRELVGAAVAHVAAAGGDLIWCNARVSAETFYQRAGFRTVTDRFDVPDVPEEHVGMVSPIGDPNGGIR